MPAKALQDKTLVRKSSKYKGAKKAKQRLTTAFFVAADRTKVGEPVVIWKSRSPSQDVLKIFETKHDQEKDFANEKVWMNSAIMKMIMKKMDRTVKSEGRNIILFLPKDTSRFQPLDAAIIGVFKCIYRKLLVKFITTGKQQQKY